MLLELLALDVLMLPIGPPGTVGVPPGWTRLETGRPSSPAEVAHAAALTRFVFVGESHDHPGHHEAQAAVIEALVASGRRVSVGFEMFTRDNQSSLGAWSLGRWSESEFIEGSQWKTQWGFDYALYRPIFEVVRRHGLPMVALNVPRQWVREVGRTGPSAITDARRAWVPELDLGDRDHRSIFDGLMGGHPGSGPSMDNVYAAQVTWDTGMAKSALDAMGSSTNPSRVMVVIAGIGHTMYGRGINGRIHRATGEASVNVACIEGDATRRVSRGLADFVFMAPAPARKEGG